MLFFGFSVSISLSKSSSRFKAHCFTLYIGSKTRLVSVSPCMAFPAIGSVYTFGLGDGSNSGIHGMRERRHYSVPMDALLFG